MKKFVSLLATLSLVCSLTFAFTACGGGDVTGPTSTPGVSAEWTAAADAFEAKVADVNAAINSTKKDEQGNIIDDLYTRSSVKEMQDMLKNIGKLEAEGKTVDQLNAYTQTMTEALNKLVTVDTHMDNKIKGAIEKLDLYEKYGDEYNDQYGETTYRYKEYLEEHPELMGKPVVGYFEENGNFVHCTEEEGGSKIANKGVEKIIYNTETNTADFILYEESLDMKLITFISTGILDIFETDFHDLTSVIFTLDEVDENGNPIKVAMTREMSNGTYLAAGVLAFCIGDTYTDAFVDFAVTGNTGNFNTILTGLKNADFSWVAGKGCSVDVTFAQDGEYIKSLTFTVNFIAPDVE